MGDWREATCYLVLDVRGVTGRSGLVVVAGGGLLIFEKFWWAVLGVIFDEIRG